MNNKVKKITALLIALIMVVAFCETNVVSAEAKSKKVVSFCTNWDGDITISDDKGVMTGWIRVGKDTYYAHRTESRMYSKGQVARNTYRVNNNKFYYFCNDGRMLKKSTKYIKLNKDKSVKYIYPPSDGWAGYRYNTKLRRYQYRDSNGKWISTGNQCYPYGMVDWQV